MPETVTVQFAPEVEVHPDHEENALPPAVAGAVSVTEVPLLYVSAKPVLPPLRLWLSAGEAEIGTPEAGLAEFTVSVYVTAAAVAYMAVTVVLAFITTVQLAPFALPHPDQDEKLFPPVAAAAVSVTGVPAVYVRIKPVVPDDLA